MANYLLILENLFSRKTLHTAGIEPCPGIHSRIIGKRKPVNFIHQDGRVVKALDLSSNGRMSAWVRSPLLVKQDFRHIIPKICEIYVIEVKSERLTYHGGRVDRAFYWSRDGPNRMWVQTPVESKAIFVKKWKTWFEIITKMNLRHFLHQDGRVVKALDLSSNGQMSAWVQTPLLAGDSFAMIWSEMWEYGLKKWPGKWVLGWPSG